MWSFLVFLCNYQFYNHTNNGDYMKNQSLWVNNINANIEKTLNKDIEVDVLIIGGGLTGISTAFYLKNSNLNIALIEQDRVGFGVSSRTTGKLTYLQELIYHKLETNFNFETSKKYLESQKYAINLILDNINKYQIDCNLTKNDSYTFTNEETEIVNFKKEEAFFKKAGVKFSTAKNLPIKLACKYVIKVEDTYVFHPLKYILELKKICLDNNIKIYENTKATKLDKVNDEYICYTDKYKIIAKKVVVSTHYPFFVVPGFIPLKTHVEKAYVTASLVDQTKDFNAITNTYPIKSIRYYNDKSNYIIFAGKSHKLCNHLNREEQYKSLEKEVKVSLSKNIEFIWSNQDIMSNDNLPLIGVLHKSEPNLLVGIAYNTWGMTNATLAGKILSDIILNKHNEYINLFNPNRAISLDKVKNLVLNSCYNLKAFALTKLKRNYSWYDSSVKFEIRNGKKVGIYTDKSGIEHIVHNLCPHLKCSLIFNERDKTWDCPCHGSRFDIDGNVIEGPSVYNIKIDK